MEPVIFHADMDAFFVSVEELFEPSLKGKAVIVGGLPNQRGVVSAASYEARKYGVHSAMPLVTAKRLCPHAVFLPGRRDKYCEYSRKAEGIFRRFTPVVEMVSIDEAYLDFTGSERLHGAPLSVAHRLRSEVERETGLSVSIGISRTKLVSKVASDLAKPRGILWVLPSHEASLLGPLKVGKLPGVGKATEMQLRDLGVMTVADLAALGRQSLNDLFGQWGESLYCKAQGQNTAHFDFHDEPVSISNEHTFAQDTSDPEEVELTLAQLVEKAAHRLRAHRMFARTITLKLRDLHFLTVTRAASLKEPTHLDGEILDRVLQLLHRSWDCKTKIRLVGVGLSGLGYATMQGHLFERESREKKTRLYEAADKIRGKFGFDSITSARTVK